MAAQYSFTDQAGPVGREVQAAQPVAGIAAKRSPLVRRSDFKHRYKATHAMDFARGVAELAAAVQRIGRVGFRSASRSMSTKSSLRCSIPRKWALPAC